MAAVPPADDLQGGDARKLSVAPCPSALWGMLVFTVPAPLSGRSYPSGMVGMEKRMVAIPSGDCPVRVSSPLSCIAVLCAVPLAAEQRGCEMDSCLCVGGAGCRGIVSPVYGDGDTCFLCNLPDLLHAL